MIYAFKDLKNKLKAGMRVKGFGYPNICNELNSGKIGIVTYVNDDMRFFSINGCEHRMVGDGNNSTLEILDESPEEITWETLKVGDRVIQYTGAKEQVVLGVLGDLIALSWPTDHSWVESWVTKDWLKTCKIVQPEPSEKSMTLEQIEKELGYKVKIVE